MSPLRLLPAILLLLGLAPAPLGAQDATVAVGGYEDGAVRELQRLLARGTYRVLDRDTVLPPTFVHAGDLVVLRADVRLEGTVQGAVAVIDGVLFLRPGSVVAGRIVSLRGEVLPSAHARHGEVLEARAADVRVSRDGSVYQVLTIAPPRQPALVLPGVVGLGMPTYDRVNGASLSGSAEWRILRERRGPTLTPWVAYRSARGELDGGARLRLPLPGGLSAEARAERTTPTNDAWINSTLSNTLFALFAGRDYRNYYASERAQLALLQPDTAVLIAGERALTGRLVLHASRDRSLRATQPWSLFRADSAWRENPPIDEGEIVSAGVGAHLRWQGQTSQFEGDAFVEQGLAGAGDFEFSQATLGGSYTMAGLRQQQLTVSARALLPFGGGSVPRQRWGILGGTGTLPTFAIGSLRGDHLVFVESVFLQPLPWLRLPLSRDPASLQLTHAVGSAWAGDETPDWEQNLGAGLTWSFFEAQVFVDPARRPLEPTFSLGLLLPF